MTLAVPSASADAHMQLVFLLLREFYVCLQIQNDNGDYAGGGNTVFRYCTGLWKYTFVTQLLI